MSEREREKRCASDDDDESLDVIFICLSGEQCAVLVDAGAARYYILSSIVL